MVSLSPCTLFLFPFDFIFNLVLDLVSFCFLFILFRHVAALSLALRRFSVFLGIEADSRTKKPLHFQEVGNYSRSVTSFPFSSLTILRGFACSFGCAFPLSPSFFAQLRKAAFQSFIGFLPTFQPFEM